MEFVLDEPEYFQNFIEVYLERTRIMQWDAYDIYPDVATADTAAREDVMRVHTNFVEDKPIERDN